MTNPQSKNTQEPRGGSFFMPTYKSLYGKIPPKNFSDIYVVDVEGGEKHWIEKITKSRVNSSLKPFIEVKENGLILKVLSFLISKGRCPTQTGVPSGEKWIFTEERRLRHIKGEKISKAIPFILLIIVLCYVMKRHGEWISVESLSKSCGKVMEFVLDRAVDALIKKLRHRMNNRASIDR